MALFRLDAVCNARLHFRPSAIMYGESKSMKQAFLPGFPNGAEKIGSGLSILREDGLITYIVGADNHFSHAQGDRSGERFALTSLMANWHVRAVDLERSSLCIPRTEP